MNSERKKAEQAMFGDLFNDWTWNGGDCRWEKGNMRVWMKYLNKGRSPLLEFEAWYSENRLEVFGPFDTPRKAIDAISTGK